MDEHLFKVGTTFDCWESFKDALEQYSQICHVGNSNVTDITFQRILETLGAHFIYLQALNLKSFTAITKQSSWKVHAMQCLIQDKISTSPSPTDRRAVVAPRGRARLSHWAIFLINNIAITNNSTFPKIKLHYSISYCNKTKSNNLI